MPHRIRYTASRTLLLVLLAAVALSLGARRAEGSSIAFSIQFGSVGSGRFTYDDDNGGANRGFRVFDLDFSSVNVALADLTLGASVPFSYGATTARFGAGGPDGQDLFRIFTDPTHDGAQYLSFSNPNFLLLLTGQGADSAARPAISIGGLCTTPAAYPPAAFSFCTPDQGGLGVWTARNDAPATVPEPASLLLLGTGLTGVLVRRAAHT